MDEYTTFANVVNGISTAGPQITHGRASGISRKHRAGVIIAQNCFQELVLLVMATLLQIQDIDRPHCF